MKNEKETTFLKSTQQNYDDLQKTSKTILYDKSQRPSPLIKNPFSKDSFKNDNSQMQTDNSKIKPSKIEQLIEQKLKEKQLSSQSQNNLYKNFNASNNFANNSTSNLSRNNIENKNSFKLESIQQNKIETTAKIKTDNNVKGNIVHQHRDDTTKNNIYSGNTFLPTKKTTKNPFRKKSKPIVLETPNYDFIETSNIENPNNVAEMQTKKKNKKRFRAKLSVMLYLIVLIVCSGWTIFNAFNISSITNDISKINYSINEFNYIIKIEQLDIINNHENSIITNIIEVTSPALIEPTTIQPQTNWFDRLCSWLANLFK